MYIENYSGFYSSIQLAESNVPSPCGGGISFWRDKWNGKTEKHH
jgi:hypothetical protein